jgi:hypothetical protein
MTYRNCYIAICISTLVFTAPECLAQDEDTDTVTVSKEKLSDRFIPPDENEKQLVPERKLQPQKLEKLRNDDAFWYVNQIREKPKPEKPPTEGWFFKLLRQPWLGPVLWILVIGGFIGILIWFLLSGDVSLFRKAPQKKKRTENGEEAENIFDINFDEAIANAVKAGDLRMAVRYTYLQLLKELSEKNIIQYTQQRPDSDYVMQLFGRSYYQQFFRITRNFEYAWYGGFHVSSAAFETIRADVNNLKGSIA